MLSIFSSGSGMANSSGAVLSSLRTGNKHIGVLSSIVAAGVLAVSYCSLKFRTRKVEEVHSVDFLVKILFDAKAKGQLRYLDCNELLNGEGRIARNHGHLIEEGYFKNDVLHGEGTIISDGVIIAKGLFENGELVQGMKVEVFDVGVWDPHLPEDRLKWFKEKKVLTGTFINGNLEGEGTITYRNGDVAKGHFREGKLHGQGEYFDAQDGVKYKGQFANHKLNGEGSIEKEGHYILKGFFKDNLLHGKGTCHTNGCEEKGDFENNLLHGQGMRTFYLPKCVILEGGTYNKGELVKKGNLLEMVENTSTISKEE